MSSSSLSLQQEVQHRRIHQVVPIELETPRGLVELAGDRQEPARELRSRLRRAERRARSNT